MSGDGIAEFHLPPTYEYTFDQMRATFGNLIHSVVPLIKSTVFSSSSSSESLFEDVSSLEELKTYLRRCFRELKPQLSTAKSFDDVIDVVEEKCTIINICCLETIINHYNIKEAKDHITAYKLAIEKFCEEIKLNVCCHKNFQITSTCLLKCETIKFVLEWEADEYSLYDVRVLLQKAFQDMAKKVQVRYITEGNSITIICYAPRHIMDVLLMKAEENLDLLRDIGLIKLTISFYKIWDGRTRDKVRNE